MRVTTDDPDAKSDDYERGFEQGVRSVLRIRCFPHKDQPQLNATEITGGECASCAWDAGHAAGYEAAEAKWRPVVEAWRAVFAAAWTVEGTGRSVGMEAVPKYGPEHFRRSDSEAKP